MSRSFKVCRVEVGSINRPFESITKIGLGITHADVLPPLPHHLEFGVLQGGDHVGPILDHARLDTLTQVVGDYPPRIFFQFYTVAQRRGLDVGDVAHAPWLKIPRTLRIIRSCPAMEEIGVIPQRIKIPLPSWRCDIHRFAGMQIAPRDEYVDMTSATLFPVENGRPTNAIGFKTRECNPFKLIQDGVNLLRSWMIVRRPCNHPGGIAMHGFHGLRHHGDLIGISSQYGNAWTGMALVIQWANQIARCLSC